MVRQRKKQSEQAHLRALAGAVGDFIGYWGFRRIHGQIWTIVYLSPSPIAGVELVRRLKVSKALVSPALKELEDYGLISQVRGADGRTKQFIANPDVMSVIKSVLKIREVPMLNRVRSEVTRLKSTADGLDMARLQRLEGMVLTANIALHALVQIDDFTDLAESLNEATE